MIEKIKIKARDELFRIYKNQTGEDFGKLKEHNQSLQATRFYINEIRNPLSISISEDEIDAGQVDGSNDLGCDFIHRDDGHVLIIQTKYRGHGKDEPANEISHFLSIIKRLHDPKLTAKQQLNDALVDIDWENDTFEFIFLTFGKLSGQARGITTQQPNYPDDVPGLEDRCDWKFFDEEDLNIELRNARNFHSSINDEVITLYPTGEKGQRGEDCVVEIDAGGYKSYIMALDAQQIIRCYMELNRDSLFSLNIRNFIGSTSTNKNIIASARSESDNFFLYNNGISCLASKVALYKDRLEITGLQVINGAQTVKALVTLANDAKKKKEQLWSKDHVPQILVRISEIPPGYGEGAKVREKITQYNNTQNTVRVSDFRSNDPIQHSLKKQFSETTRMGRKVSYVPKRTDKVHSSHEIIRMEEYSKSVYSFLYNPTEFSGSSSFLFSLEKEHGYSRVFGDGTNLWEEMPEDEFRLRAGAYWISQEFAKHLKSVRDQETDPDSKAALERKWLVVFAASAVYRLLHGEPGWRNRVRQLHKGDWSLETPGKGEEVKEVFKYARIGVINAYKNSKKHDTGFVHRNWMRGKNTPKLIESYIADNVIPLIKDIGTTQ
jgi:hypothetical protein